MSTSFMAQEVSGLRFQGLGLCRIKVLGTRRISGLRCLKWVIDGTLRVIQSPMRNKECELKPSIASW